MVIRLSEAKSFVLVTDVVTFGSGLELRGLNHFLLIGGV